MKTILLKLQDPQMHTGHCQITYNSRNDAGQRLVYCLQDNGERCGGVRLMRCSQDGEPSHEVSFSQVRAVFERPTGDSKLEALVNKWIDSYEAQPKESV